MSKICSTFALEIGKDVLLTCFGEAERATLGSDPGGIAEAKTHTASVRAKKRVTFSDFGSPAFLFLVYEKNTIHFVRDNP